MPTLPAGLLSSLAGAPDTTPGARTAHPQCPGTQIAGRGYAGWWARVGASRHPPAWPERVIAVFQAAGGFFRPRRPSLAPALF